MVSMDFTVEQRNELSYDVRIVFLNLINSMIVIYYLKFVL